MKEIVFCIPHVNRGGDIVHTVHSCQLGIENNAHLYLYG